jgi:hypothetical protein
LMYLLIQTLQPQTISTLPTHKQQLGQTSPSHTSHPQPLCLTSWKKFISSLTATADKHLQKFKQRKYIHSN